MMTGLARDRVILDEVYNETITEIDAASVELDRVDEIEPGLGKE